VKVANGARLACQSQFKQVQWEVQVLPFVSDLKVLQLQHFDMILDYDWLEQFSPMKIHWGAKWLVIPYGSKSVVLQGILSELQSGDVVQLYQLAEEDLQLDVNEEKPVDSTFLPEIQQLLVKYGDVFATKVYFPPTGACSHTIPLVTGARPFHIRPYHYAPVLKDEIER
jgi:hypothetical protein